MKKEKGRMIQVMGREGEVGSSEMSKVRGAVRISHTNSCHGIGKSIITTDNNGGVGCNDCEQF